MMQTTARTLWIALVMICLPGLPAQAIFLGEQLPSSFSMCEETEDAEGLERDECRASDVRFELDTAGPADSNFGFAIASGSTLR